MPNPSSKNTNVTGADVASDKNMFLKLLVTQLKNQDPLKPTDSTTFVTQLAQFQQLEATVNMEQDVTGIHTDTSQLVSGLSVSNNPNGTPQS
jgi:flagellar basal-body rod modification protein FlgD